MAKPPEAKVKDDVAILLIMGVMLTKSRAKPKTKIADPQIKKDFNFSVIDLFDNRACPHTTPQIV